MKQTYVYDHYYKYQEITDILNKYAEEHSDIARLSSIGTTEQGRNIWLMEITDLTTGDYSDKPALYIEGNIHAGEVTGCMTVMFLLDTIFTNCDTDEIKKILAQYTIYAVPRVSPDGSEYFLTTEDTVRSVPKMYPYDTEMPGLYRKDLDGDGVARLMRVKSKFGVWKVSDKDPRLMTKRAPDETEGEFYNVYDEGIINEFDGINIVDAPAKYGNDFNRNYPIGWETEDKQRGAGKYPLANNETKANADFLLSHPNVCFVIDMHTAGGQNLYTPGYKSAKQAIREDIDLFKAMGKMANEENGYPVLNVFDEYMPASASVTYGGFDDFCHFVLGIPAMTIECWDLPVRAGLDVKYPPKENLSDAEQEEDALKYLKWADENLSKEEGFKDWTKVQHPQLGEVEVGGYNVKFFRQNPPSKFLHQEVEKHTRFALRAVKALPNVNFENIDVQAISEDVFKIEAVVGNSGYMSTYIFKEGLKNKSLKPLKVEMIGEYELIQGKNEEQIGHLQGLSGIKTVNGLAPYSRQSAELCKKITWIIKAKKGTELKFVCSGGRIGKTEAKVTL